MRTEYIKYNMILVGFVVGWISNNSFAKDDYSFPVSFQKNISTYTVNKDGSFQEVHEISRRIENEDGVANYGEEKISYTPKLEEIKILDAYTILPNGAHIKVPAANIRTAKGDMDNSASSYSDTQYKVIIYPNVVVGSQQYSKYILVRHTPLFRGQFFFRKNISPHIKFAQFEINIMFDQKINIAVNSKGFTGGRLPDKDGMHYYQFSIKQLETLPMEDDQISPEDYAPYVQASTFRDYGALGAAYQEKAKSQVKVTAAIHKLANELTVGVDDKKQQARLLYNWVSRNIRYVGSYIGNGGYVPHDSQSILDNRWGDCKDHVVILESLLAAKGIESSPALINTNDSYVLPDLPIMAFNHVITYVPSLDLFLDSTSQFARFGTLPRSDLNKSVVLTGLNSLGKTPPMNARDNASNTSIRLSVLPSGEINGTSETSATGSEEIHYRNQRFDSQSVPQVQLVNDQLNKANLTGVGEIHSSNPSDIDKQFVIRTTFSLDPVSNIPATAAMPIPAGLAFGVIDSKMQTKPKDKLIFPSSCDSISISNHYEIEFPTNIKITHVPENVSYSDAVVQYNATYLLKANMLEINRELVQQYPTMVCGEAENDLDKKFFPVFQRDMRAQVIYE
jgi:transglutaminase-like putative cysteine protease